MRSTWTRLIHKIYNVDPLEWPKCKSPMHVIALVDDKAVISRILTPLDLWAPQVAAAKGAGTTVP